MPDETFAEYCTPFEVKVAGTLQAYAPTRTFVKVTEEVPADETVAHC